MQTCGRIGCPGLHGDDGTTPWLSVQAAIANAATLEEVQRLENALKTGIVPSEVQVGVRASHMLVAAWI